MPKIEQICILSSPKQCKKIKFISLLEHPFHFKRIFTKFQPIMHLLRDYLFSRRREGVTKKKSITAGGTVYW